MKLQQLWALFERARDNIGHTDYVVIGSLSALGLEPDTPLPTDMTVSIDVDCYTLNDPPRIFDLANVLGEGSAFQAEQGYFLDPVSPGLPTLPDGWQGRMNRIEQNGLRLWFLSPDDAAISKYARSEPRDLRWVRAGILHGLISLPTVRARMRQTVFLDDAEAARVHQQVAADTRWFESITAQRLGGRPDPD